MFFDMYLKGRNFRGKKISRVSRISLEFVKVNSREKFEFSKFAKLNSREKFEFSKFAKLNFRKKFDFMQFAKFDFREKKCFSIREIKFLQKKIIFLMLDFNGKSTPFPLLSLVSFTLDYNGKFLKVCVLKILLVFYIFSLTKKIIQDQIKIKILIFH